MKKIYVPANIREFAKSHNLTRHVNKVANWLNKIEKRIVGGTAIGKDYSTLILDITFHGAEIYINSHDNGSVSIEFYGENVSNFKEFKNVYQNINSNSEVNNENN